MSEQVPDPVPKRVGDRYLIEIPSEHGGKGMQILFFGPFPIIPRDEERYFCHIFHLRMLDEAEVPYVVVGYTSRGW